MCFFVLRSVLDGVSKVQKTKKARRREPVLLSKSNLSPQIIQISRYNIKLILSQNPTKIQANPTFAALIFAVSL